MKKLRGKYNFPDTDYVVLTKGRGSRRRFKNANDNRVTVGPSDGYVDKNGTIIIDDSILPEEGFSLEYANYNAPLEDCEPINKN